MKDIRYDLRERLQAIAKDSASLRSKLAQNDSEEVMLKALLQREDDRFGPLEASLPLLSNGIDGDQSNDGGTPLARFIVNTIKTAGRPVTLDDLKTAAENVSFDFGAKKPGRVLHWALVAMSENNIVVRNGEGWKLKEVTN